MSKIKQSIEKLLQKHRILLWYDAEQSFTEEYESLDLENAEKVEVDGNEFEVKVQTLLKQPDQKFLLYIPKDKPEDEENWLLDIELAHHVYHTDQEALYLQEVGLGYHYKGWIRNHIEFFKNKERVAAFKEIAQEEDGDHLLSLKLLQVVFKADSVSLEQYLRAYTVAFVEERVEQLERDLERFQLKEIFWEEVTKKYGYTHESPTIYDFLLEVFQKNFTPLSKKSVVNRETGVMLSAWKDTLSFQESFKAISHRIQKDLNIEDTLNDVSLDEIIQDDLFELIDQRIISELIRGILDDSVDRQRLERVIKKRESKYWFDRYQSFYSALIDGFSLLEMVQDEEQFSIDDFGEGVELYTKKWYKVDQYYRTFIEHYRSTSQNNVLNKLYQAVNKAYSNTWLLKLSDAWQNRLDEDGKWGNKSKAQTDFFKRDVKPFLKKNVRLFVIISDALRYECGLSFNSLMKKENRFSTTLDHRVTTLPSYTKLGMASMLPHNSITFGKNDDILIDGKSTKGLSARQKVLKENSGASATAIGAEDLMKMASKSSEARDLVTNHDLIYIYHNRIDKTGDDKTSEEKVIEESNKEIQFLVELVKKVSNIGGYNILITADHGFIYQNDVLEESDFADAEVSGDVIKTNRRFVLGRNLSHKDNVTKYAAEDLGIDDDMEILIPKGINRLRVQGAGSRFVHGGATLQEVVVPVIHVKKEREDTVKQVEVDVLNKRSNKISTNIQRVTLYQLEPVSEHTLGRTLKIQFKSDDGETLSDVIQYTFDSESDNTKEREYEHRFQLSSKASNEYKNQTVYLTLEEQVEGSNKWVEYQKFPYTINISFTNDFDDF